MHKSIADTLCWLNTRNRWWIPLVAGCLYPLAFQPFSSETHPLFALFPLLGLVVLVPLFAIACTGSFKRAALHCYLFGLTASFFQFYWIANVVADGLWHMILIGLVAATLFFALYFLAAGLLFRLLTKRLRSFALITYPSLWIMLEWLRGYGEIGFPWNFLGYSIAQIVLLGQIASVCGIFGLSFIVVVGNMLLWNLLTSDRPFKRAVVPYGLFIAGLLAVAIWGAVRMKPLDTTSHSLKIALVQNNIDQAHWGSGSLDSTLSITGSMVLAAAPSRPDLIVLPESALFCYMMRRPSIKTLVTSWSDSVKTAMLLGTLHWERAAQGQGDYAVFNSAFLVNPVEPRFTPYYKMTLLPFSEAMPFKGIIPLVNRINLGGSDFSAGKDPVVFTIKDSIRLVPLICYESIYAGQVRKRVAHGADLIVNITNDGWFGRSTAAYQHAFMARMSCVQNGIAMARCANSGISMLVDQYGRVIQKTQLYTRTTLHGTVSLQRIPTLYSRFGDWPLGFALFFLGIGLVVIGIRRVFR
jgi:apolipoprotein N-acyltransferase